MKLTAFLQRSYKYFRKPKTTILLILVNLVLFVLGLLIPQKRFYPSPQEYEQWKLQNPVISAAIESLQLNEIYISPVTIVFLGLFFINLLAVVAHRIPSIMRRSYLLDRRKSLAGIEHLKEEESARKIAVDCGCRQEAAEATGRAALFFRKRFWTIFRAGDSGFMAVRNRLSPIGFLLFHLSFLLCLIGGLLLVYTRFSGNLTLTEGEEFYADMTKFSIVRNDPVLFKALPNFGITVVKVTPRYDGSVGTDLNVLMRLKYETEVLDVRAKVNEPVNKGPISILPGNIGISPLFVLKKQESGEEVGGGYFSLKVLKGEEDSFEFPGMPYKVYVNFFPDFAEEKGMGTTRSLEMKNPVFQLRVEQKGKTLYEGRLKPGEPAAFDGLEISCMEIRYWVDFLVVREYGKSLLFAGFLIGAVGLVMRLIFYQKTVRVYMEYHEAVCVFFVAGRSEYYPEMFQEELDSLCHELARQLKAQGAPASGEGRI